jgi:hypothetical protein
MSKQMITTFFPAFTEALNTNRIPLGSFYLNDLLFPDATAQACREITLSLSVQNHDHKIRQPVLCLTAIGGVMVGLIGALQLSSRSSNSHIWVVSFLAFGIMNLSAIWLHCLLPSPSEYDQESSASIYPEVYPMLWMIDTYMTGVASTGLLVASLLETNQKRQSQTNDKARWHLLFWLLQGIGLACLASFVLNLAVWLLEGVGLAFLASFLLHTGKGKMVDMDLSIRTTYPLELWYLLPPLFATIPVIQLLFGPIVVRHPSSGEIGVFPEWRRKNNASTTEEATTSKSRTWTLAHTLFVTSLLLTTFFGIGLDRFWCWAIHSRPGGGTFGFFLWDLLTNSTLTFLACDLAFLGILIWLLDNYD